MRNIKEENSSITHNPICQTRLVYKQSAQLGSFWSFTYNVFWIKGMILPPPDTKITTLIFFVKITHIPKKSIVQHQHMENNSIVKWKKKRKKGLVLNCKRLEIPLDFWTTEMSACVCVCVSVVVWVCVFVCVHVCETNKPISHSFLLPVSPNHSVTNFTEQLCQKTAEVAVKSAHQWEFDTQENRRKKKPTFFSF